MNTVSRHPKVKLDVFLNSSLFQAGGAITGRLELTSATSQKLRLGDIAVELEGIEGENGKGLLDTVSRPESLLPPKLYPSLNR